MQDNMEPSMEARKKKRVAAGGTKGSAPVKKRVATDGRQPAARHAAPEGRKPSTKKAAEPTRTAAVKKPTAKRPAGSGKPVAKRPAEPGKTASRRPAEPGKRPRSGSAAAARKRRAAARAAALQARKQRRVALACCAVFCALCLGGALLLHAMGRHDLTRDQRAGSAPEAVIAAQPLEAGADGVLVAHANKPDVGSQTPVNSLPEIVAPVETEPEIPTDDGEQTPWSASDAEEDLPDFLNEEVDASTFIEPMATAPIPEVRRILAMGDIVETARATNKAYKYESKIVANGSVVKSYSRQTPVAMGESDEYSQVEGILTFRGNNYRDSGAYGTIPDDASGLDIAWTKRIGAIGKWSGVGWTGQASIVRWPQQTREIMNINSEKKDKDGLKEVIYGTLDGHIYFLDLEDGEATRDAIAVPSSIKGSVSVDPRGIPLLYCGQGIPEVDGKNVKIGTRIFSLIDQEMLLFINGRDDFCLRRWYAFDCAPLVDAASDTMLQLGENGIFYSVTLNTQYDPYAGTVSIDPVIDRQIYKSGVSKRPGMENSLAVYDHYAYYTDNSGLLTCLDVNTLEPVWLGYVGDDSDASIVIEQDDQGVWLYQNCELDLTGLRGDVYCRKFNALTGEEIWKIPVACKRSSESVDAGGFATPAVGKGPLGNMVFFNICRVKEAGGKLMAVDKQTGDILWERTVGGYSWSSPVCLSDSQERGYLLFGNSKGELHLCDGLTGEDIATVDLGANIEGSPAVFDDMLVIGTRGGRIFGVKITGDEI